MRDPALLVSDLRSGGRILLKDLEFLKARNDLLMLAVVRAGVPPAVEIAKHLGLPLDVICLRRLLVASEGTSYLCAVNVAGHLFVDAGVARNDPGFEPFLADA